MSIVHHVNCSNIMSIVPKIDEVNLFVTNNQTDFVFVTETWLNDSVSSSYLHIPGYHFINKNRSSGIHGGVGIYIKNEIKFDILNYLHDPGFEVLWVRTRPIRLPRGLSCVITGTVYHPLSADDKRILDYLLKSLTEIEGRHQAAVSCYQVTLIVLM